MIKQDGTADRGHDRADIDFVDASDQAFLDALPLHGAENPSTGLQGTSPGSSGYGILPVLKHSLVAIPVW